jgi:DNA-binding response OmpR family regulator
MAKILIVEDDIELKNNIIEYLENWNHFIKSSSNGIEAFTILQDFIPDIIICDIRMPKMNGLQFLKEKQKNTLLRYIPLIFITANSSIDEKLTGLGFGAIDYITKPFEIKEILLKIENIMLVRQNYEISKILPPKTEFSEDILFKTLFEETILTLITDPNLMIGDVAFQMNMSISTLQRGINRYYKKSFSDLIKEYRMEKAIEFLSKTDKSIQEISLICGFNSLSYFSKSFKDAYNISPIKYRFEKTK